MIRMKKKVSKRITSAIYLLIVLALLAVVAPQPVAAAPVAQTACAARHTVAAGETLSSIALEYGVDWTAIAAANSLTDPYVIFVGQVLCIPEGATNVEDDTDDDTTTTTTSGPSFTVTLEEDNFIRIKTVNYPKYQSHIVKAGTLVKRLAWLELEIIGRFATNKTGGSDALIRLPQDYRDQVLIVCLKNAFNDKIECELFDPFEE